MDSNKIKIRFPLRKLDIIKVKKSKPEVIDKMKSITESKPEVIYKMNSIIESKPEIKPEVIDKMKPINQQTKPKLKSTKIEIYENIMKQCNNCNVEKNISEFHKNGFDKFGKQQRRPACRICDGIISKNYPSHSKELLKKSYEKTKEWRKEYYQLNKSWLKDHMANWYIDNKDQINQQHKEYRENNVEKEKIRHARHFAENKEKILQTRRIYYDNNLDKKFALSVRSRVGSIYKSGKGYEELLDCDPLFLQSWIEFNLQFEVKIDGHMHKLNHGTYWHLDHLIP